ncbi:universal stress protein [Ornithinimicrobium sp. W1665]|uniref:universal stress protein n=1 Tax=Ornithinimicrobium sp. W1665 TaxID=3416666 RepID=UPI003CFBB483
MSYSKIMVPVAPDHGPEAGRAMEVARSLLSPGGRITVLSVIEELPRYLTADIYSIGPVVVEKERAVADAVKEEFGGAPDVTVVTRIGHGARTILDLAEDGGHDCIVIASAQPGWQHTLMGSTASGVVRHAHCSVHVLRETGSGPTA